MRTFRRAVDVGLPILGVALVLVAVLFVENPYIQIALVLLGLVMIKPEVWNRPSPVLPSDRKFVALRREVDSFILLVRRLNRASLELTSEPTPNNRAKLLQVRDEMLESVKRMEQYAGKADDGAVQPGSPAAGSPATGTLASGPGSAGAVPASG